MKFFHLGSLIFTGIVSGLAFTASAATTQIVAPNDLANAEGNTFADYPFDGVQSSMRFQQVYAASQFSAIANGGGFISLIAFRTDGDCGGTSTGVQTDSSLQVNLSTTSKGPDSLSPIFAENVGLDDQVVRSSGSLTFIQACGPSSPQPFVNFIPLNSPFFYNPAFGNLLVDIRNFSGPMFPSAIGFDAQNTMGDSISSLTAFNVNTTTADEVSSSGYVTEFIVQPVPEPRTWALFALGLVAISVSAYRRSQRRKNVPH